MVESTARFRFSSDVVARDIDEGLLLVDLANGATWRLDQVGAAVCRKLDGETDVAAIVSDLDRRYRVGAERLLRDVGDLLEQLRDKGLIEPSAAVR